MVSNGITLTEALLFVNDLIGRRVNVIIGSSRVSAITSMEGILAHWSDGDPEAINHSQFCGLYTLGWGDGGSGMFDLTALAGCEMNVSQDGRLLSIRLDRNTVLGVEAADDE